MGGAKSVLKKAKDSFDKGDYRWVGEVQNHVVFADSKSQTASEVPLFVPIPPVGARGHCYEIPSTYLFGFVAGILAAGLAFGTRALAEPDPLPSWNDGSAGNSAGDREMLEWTGAGRGARLIVLVFHATPSASMPMVPRTGCPTPSSAHSPSH
jgi:hypothetical protein